mgnify:CR=1 FL=1
MKNWRSNINHFIYYRICIVKYIINKICIENNTDLPIQILNRKIRIVIHKILTTLFETGHFIGLWNKDIVVGVRSL